MSLEEVLRSKKTRFKELVELRKGMVDYGLYFSEGLTLQEQLKYANLGIYVLSGELGYKTWKNR